MTKQKILSMRELNKQLFMLKYGKIIENIGWTLLFIIAMLFVSFGNNF